MHGSPRRGQAGLTLHEHARQEAAAGSCREEEVQQAPSPSHAAPRVEKLEVVLPDYDKDSRPVRWQFMPGRVFCVHRRLRGKAL